MTTSDAPEQPRVPGVRYRKATRHRVETTTIGGRSATREVPYVVWEPVPPRDLDLFVLRAVTGVAVGATALTVVGTTASVGGLLRLVVPALVAYSVALVFDAVWLACLGIEWLTRLDPKRARPARIGGWVALLISIGAVFAYGSSLKEPVAGLVTAAVGVLSKGLWSLVLRHYAVPLSEPVAFWLRAQQEEATASTAVAGHQRRIDRQAAYLRAVYPEAVNVSEAVTTTHGESGLTAPDASGQVSGHVPMVSGTATTPLPLPVAESRTPDVSAQAPPMPGYAPAAPVPALRQPYVPIAPSLTPEPAATPAPQTGGGQEESGYEAPAGDGASLHAVGAPSSIASAVRAVLAEQPAITDQELIRRVATVHPGGDPVKLTDTVTRTRRRIEKKQKRNAS